MFAFIILLIIFASLLKPDSSPADTAGSSLHPPGGRVYSTYVVSHEQRIDFLRIIPSKIDTKRKSASEINDPIPAIEQNAIAADREIACNISHLYVKNESIYYQQNCLVLPLLRAPPA